MNSAPTATRVVIADDHQLVRTGYSALFNALSRFRFAGSDLDGATLTGCDLSDSTLTGVSLRDCDLRGARLTGADSQART
jgi:uncharacterized protein YjbI with pentapeptide repeats